MGLAAAQLALLISDNPLHDCLRHAVVGDEVTAATETRRGAPVRTRDSARQFMLGFGCARSRHSYLFHARAQQYPDRLHLPDRDVLLSLRGSLALSLIAVGCLNYFFISPAFAFRLGALVGGLELAAFLTAAVVVTRVVSRSREAESRAAERAHSK